MTDKDKNNDCLNPQEEIFDEDELSFVKESEEKFHKDILDSSKKNSLKDKFNW